MARPAVFTWPVPSNNSIALTQDASLSPLILNGSLVNYTQAPYFAVFPGISRVVTLTSTDDLSASSWIITGTLNGATVTQTVTGPNNTTVASTKVFDTVTSVTLEGALLGDPDVVTHLSVGTGTTGYTHWFNHNYQSTVAALAVAVDITGTINYDFQTTLDDVNTNATPKVFAPIDGISGSPGYPADMTSATTDQLAIANMNIISRFSRIIINSSDATGTLVVTFIQQGLT